MKETNNVEKSILHLSTLSLWDLGKGKGRISTYLPLKGMVDAGYRIIYITNSNEQQSCNEEGIEVRRITTPFSESRVFVQLLLYPITVLIFVFKAAFEAIKIKPKIVYSHTTLTALPSYIISRIFKAKYVLRLYGIGKGAKRPWSPAGILLRFSFFVKTDCYILTNDGTNAKTIAISLGADESKIYFLKNGLNKDVCFTVDNNIKQKLVPNGEILLLSVSRLVNWKHVDDIIRLMIPLKQKQLKFKLVIIGDGPERRKLESLCKHLNLSDCIVFIGALQQKDVFKYNLISDIFISLNELSSMSNPVFEAMLAGTAIVALNRGTTTDLIKHNKNGYVIETSEELVFALEKLIINESLRQSLGSNAHDYMINNWPSWEERIQTEIDILNRITQN